MKNLVLAVLIAVNIFCFARVYSVANNLKNTVAVQAGDVSAKLDQVAKVASDIAVVKQIIGWKTDKLQDGFCIGDYEKSNKSGVFSFVVKDDSGCYTHEFTKLNSLVKALDVDFSDGRWLSYARELKNELKDKGAVYNLSDVDKALSVLEGLAQKLGK